MEQNKELLIAWMNDALENEYAFAALMEDYLDRGDHADEARKEEVGAHVEKTRSHIRALGDCIVALGGNPSGSAAFIPQRASSILEAVPKYTEVRRVINCLASVQGLIARYTAIVAAARVVEDADTAAAVDVMLSEERAAAQLLEEYLPEIVKKVMTL